MPNLVSNVVLTTIFESTILDAYYANAVEFGHLENVHTWLIPDRKTPPGVFEACVAMTERGFQCHCPSLEEQEAFLAKVGLPPDMIPHNSDNRRNVGFLMALEAGGDMLVSIDDDNFCQPGVNFFSEHAIVTTPRHELVAWESNTGFLNVCDLLEIDKPVAIYPRGFPYFARHRQECWRGVTTSGEVMINAGLWLRDPDVDGMTWLVTNPVVSGMCKSSVVLGPGSWSPVNSQNTALRQSLIPSYYFIRMGYPMPSGAIDRYGDIFSGYFAEAVTKHLGGFVRFGSPLAEHRRNSHNHLRDATQEMSCILVLEDILPWLREAKLGGATAQEAYLGLSYLLEDAVEGFRGSVWTDATRAYFHQMAYLMRRWVKACATILGTREAR